MTTCTNCQGSGVDPKAEAPKAGEESVPCPVCGGNGKVEGSATQTPKTE